MNIYLFEKYISDVEDNREVTFIDLNKDDVKIKTDILYSFLGVKFTVKYNNNLKRYTTILNSPDDSKFDIILYANNLDSMQNKIRFSAKDLIDDLETNFDNVNLNSTSEKLNLNSPLENSNIDINDTIYFYMSIDSGEVYAINKELDKNKTYKFIVDNKDKGIFKYKDSIHIKNIVNRKLKDILEYNLYI